MESATHTAARILGLGDWELRVGNRADLILVDLDRPELVPNFDLFSDLVYAANGSCVDTVICMGRVLMEHRYVEGEEEIMSHVRRLAHELPSR
jgi:5-methylthioadenosine/S-adenosylhomocysteine deaminase